MDFQLTEDHEELRASVRTFLDGESAPDFVRDVVEGRATTEPLWAAMVEIGLPALIVPEAAGGLGLGVVELVLCAEELGSHATPGPLLATIAGFVPALRELGGGEATERGLAAVVQGTTGTLAAAPAPGAAAQAGTGLSARRQGSGWVLSGRRRWVLDGDNAEEIAVTAALDGEIGLFLVPRQAVAAEPIESLDPTRRVADLVLDDVRLHDERVAGEPGSCGEAMIRAREVFTVALAAETVGACQTAFDLALEHARTREQFGVPIGSFQAVKHKLADAFIALEKARAMVRFAAMTIDEDDPRRPLATAAAAAAVSDCQRLVVREAIQLHGGVGYTWEHDLHLYVKRAKANDALLGAGPEQRARVANALLPA